MAGVFQNIDLHNPHRPAPGECGAGGGHTR